MMLRHIVMFRLKDGISRDDPRVIDAVRLIEALPREINSVAGHELGWDISRKPHSFDYVTMWLFRDQAGLDAYSAHPAHQAVLRATKDIFSASIADYFLN